MKGPNQISEVLYGTGLFLFLFLSMAFVTGTLWLFLAQDLQPFLLVLSTILTVFFLFKLTENKRVWGFSVGLGLSIIILCSVLAGHFFDFSFDGQWYHQDAIVLLSKGWNPIYEPLIPNEAVSGLNSNYVNHYPKGPWIIQTLMFQTTGNIEIGKALHTISLLALFLISLDFFKTKQGLNWLQSLSLSLFIGFSTINLGQIFSFYVDGIMYSFLGIFILLLLSIQAKQTFWSCLPLGCCLVFLVNIKFTALVYVCVFLMAYVLYLFWFKRELLRQSLLFLSVFMVFGILVFGAHGYVRNTMSKGHPFFPLMGENNEGKTIAEVQYAKNFFDMNRFEKAIAAHSAIPMYTDQQHASTPKPLFNFKLSRGSIEYYKNHQPVTMSPLGPFESELLLLFLPILVYVFWVRRGVKIFLFSAAILLSLFIQPEFWNFRYAPQLIFLMGGILFEFIRSPQIGLRSLGVVYVFLFVANGVWASSKNWEWSAEKNKKLTHTLELLSGKSVKVKKGWMMSFENKLNAFHIQPIYTEETQTMKTFPGDDFTGWKFEPKP